jgi:beta-glucanase (GH16 family)
MDFDDRQPKYSTPSLHQRLSISRRSLLACGTIAVTTFAAFNSQGIGASTTAKDTNSVAPAKLDLTSATQTLDATFETLPSFAVGRAQLRAGAPNPALNDSAFKWRAGYVETKPFRSIKQPAWNDERIPFPGFAWINHELACYPNGDAIGALGLDVITAVDGNLNLSATKAPQEALDQFPDDFTTTHISGAINTFPFAQAGGYFEIDTKLPVGSGIWPAFWLLPADRNWPPEIDVFEVLGKDPTTLYASIKFPARPDGRYESVNAIKIADPSIAFHTYGVDWDNNRIAWYIDRILVHVETTPDSLKNRACYILANVAVQNQAGWGGGPNSSTRFPATMKIRAIRAWKRG